MVNRTAVCTAPRLIGSYVSLIDIFIFGTPTSSPFTTSIPRRAVLTIEVLIQGLFQRRSKELDYPLQEPVSIYCFRQTLNFHARLLHHTRLPQQLQERLTKMVLLGGLELVAAGYIIHKHNKNKREKRRLQEEADAIEAERLNVAGPSSSHRRTHSHDGHTTHHHSRSKDAYDDDDYDDQDEELDRRGRDSKQNSRHPTHGAMYLPRPSSVPPEAYPYWDQSPQAQHMYPGVGPAPAYTAAGGPPYHPGAAQPMTYQPPPGPVNPSVYPPPPPFEAVVSGGGSNRDYYGYENTNPNGYPREKTDARASPQQPQPARRASFERVSPRPSNAAVGPSPHVRFAVPESGASSPVGERQPQRVHGGAGASRERTSNRYDNPPPEYRERDSR
jgi:hypothetical protein